MSSWLPLRLRQDQAGPLGTVLILGATGMAGLLAVQNAYALGAARVIASSSCPASRRRHRKFRELQLERHAREFKHDGNRTGRLLRQGVHESS